MDKQALQSRYDIASKRISQALITTKGGTSAESDYTVAYQALVKAGLAQQIKLKYRGRK